MNASWLSLGTQRWYQDVLLVPHPSGQGMVQELSEWYTGVNRPRNAIHGSAVSRWRIGDAASLREAAGKVVRGYEFRGRIVSPALNQASLYLMPGVLLSLTQMPISQSPTPAAARTIDFYAPASAKPLGVFPAPDEFDKHPTDEELVAAPWWAGAQSGWVTSTVPTVNDPNVNVYPIIDSLRVLLSDPVRWWVVSDGEPSVEVGQVRELKFRFVYPGAEDDPVPGLRVVIMGGGAVGVRPAGGDDSEWDTRAVASTDAEGYAVFDIIGGSPGADLMSVGLTEQDYDIQWAVHPPMPTSMVVRVTAPVAPPDPGACTTYPATPGRPAAPARVDVSDNYGWNSGANSVDTFDGDVELVFSGQQRVVGAAIGITSDREPVGPKDRLTHAFYFFQSQGGQRMFQLMEAGRAMTPAEPYDSADEFRMQRVGNTVTYLRNNRVLLTSLARSHGEVSAGCAMYSAGDSVPTGSVE